MGVQIVKCAGCLIWLHFDSPMYTMTAYPTLQDPRPPTEPDYLVLASKQLSSKKCNVSIPSNTLK